MYFLAVELSACPSVYVPQDNCQGLICKEGALGFLLETKKKNAQKFTQNRETECKAIETERSHSRYIGGTWRMIRTMLNRIPG